VNLYLPRDDEDMASGAGSDGAAAAPVGHGETVLVVEDDARVRRLTSTRLRALGYRVVEAESGPAALTQLSGGLVVDLVFTDLVMPGGISGLDLARLVAQRWPGTRVLLTSGYSKELASSNGDTTHALLRKPYRQSELAIAVAQALAGARSGRP
jgi:CheY-like chemotaxis protein